jgi:hypothetical protein
MRVERRVAVLVLVLAAQLAVLTSCSEGGEAAPGAAAAAGAMVGGDDRSGEYEGVANWWKPAPSHDSIWHWGQVSGVAADTPDRILAVTWGDMNAAGEVRQPASNMIVAADRNGNITEVWTQWDSILNWPHQIYVDPYDPARPIWVVERGGGGPYMQVLKFSNDGKQLLLRIGDTPIPQTQEEARANQHPGPYNYGQPAVLAFYPDGSFLLGDGYWNSRIVKYDKDGKYLMEWGTQGTGPGQFDVVHGLAIDLDGRVYVADRSNSRVQVFSANGEFIQEWPNITSPAGLYIDEGQNVWVVDRVLNRILKYDRDGHLLYHWGTFGGTSGGFPGGMLRPHQLDVDQEGNVYVANFDGGSVGKFVPKPGADPSKLLGPPLRLPR